LPGGLTSAREEGAGKLVPTAVRGSALEGRNARRASAARVGLKNRPGRNGLARGAILWSRGPQPASPAGYGRKRQERHGPERGTDPREGKALKAKPQERYRDETSPEGPGGSNRREREKR